MGSLIVPLASFSWAISSAFDCGWSDGDSTFGSHCPSCASMVVFGSEETADKGKTDKERREEKEREEKRAKAEREAKAAEEKKKKTEAEKNGRVISASGIFAVTNCMTDGTLSKIEWVRDPEDIPPCIKVCIEDHEKCHYEDADYGAACKKFAKAGGDKADSAAKKAMREAVRRSECKCHAQSIDCFKNKPSCCRSAPDFVRYSEKLKAEACDGK